MAADSGAEGGRDDTANIHLQLFGENRCVAVPIPPDNSEVAAILPAARLISHEITAAAVESAERAGRTVSCRAGCGACCRQLVVVSFAEARSLAEVVAAMPPDRQAVVRQRFADGLRRLEEAGLLDNREPPGERHLIQPMPTDAGPTIPPLAQRYFQQQIACPFLEDESCGIYADRPLVCREYLVTSPAERCARLYGNNVEIEGIQAPVRIAGVLVQITHKVGGAPAESIPLLLSLEWSATHPDELSARRAGLELVQVLVAEIEEERRRVFPGDNDPQ